MKKSCLIVLTALMLMPVLAQARLAQLTVTVRGLAATSGTIEVSIFNSAEKFLKKPFVQKSKPVDGKEEVVFVFAGLAEGEYAIAAVHDENGNGILDNGFLGFGGEHYGFSNDATAWLGRPSYEAAAFKFGAEDMQIVISLD